MTSHLQVLKLVYFFCNVYMFVELIFEWLFDLHVQSGLETFFVLNLLILKSTHFGPF